MTAPLGDPFVNPRYFVFAPGARRLASAVALVAAAVLVAACAAPAAPTPSPTEPPPTQAPVQASPNPNLVAFTLHIRDSTKSEGQLVRDLATAQNGSKDQLRLVARNLTAWSTNEQAWLDANIADSCYEPAYDSWRDGVNDISKAAAGFSSLVDVAIPSPDAGQAAGAQLASGGQALNTAADLADQARAACR
jgi:hypothetical protein